MGNSLLENPLSWKLQNSFNNLYIWFNIWVINFIIYVLAANYGEILLLQFLQPILSYKVQKRKIFKFRTHISFHFDILVTNKNNLMVMKICFLILQVDYIRINFKVQHIQNEHFNEESSYSPCTFLLDFGRRFWLWKLRSRWERNAQTASLYNSKRP